MVIRRKSLVMANGDGNNVETNSDSENAIIVINSDDEHAIVQSNMHRRIQTFVYTNNSPIYNSIITYNFCPNR